MGISFRHHCRISDLAAAYRRRDAIADAAEWINMDGGRWPCWKYDAYESQIDPLPAGPFYLIG